MLALEGIEIVQDDWRMTADLALAAGSSTALIGPSGSGKSTLLDAIAGFVAPARGRILWDGRDITAAAAGGAAADAALPGAQPLRPPDARRANVGLGLRPDLRLDRAGWARVEAALADGRPRGPRRSAGRASSPAGSGSGWRWRARSCAAGRS